MCCALQLLYASECREVDTICRYAGTLGERRGTVPRVDFQGRLLPGSRFAHCCSGACRRDSRSDEPVCLCRSGPFPALRSVPAFSAFQGCLALIFVPSCELRVRRCPRRCPAAAWPRLGVGRYFISRRTRQPGLLCALCPCAGCPGPGPGHFRLCPEQHRALIYLRGPGRTSLDNTVITLDVGRGEFPVAAAYLELQASLRPISGGAFLWEQSAYYLT